LLPRGHKVLIFSQFVRHLALVREAVEGLGASYLSLDGSTPAGQRAQLVERFQRGETQLFLISLKAGGTGLNLTAADYVVHMDPWWNPSVEDQASDRAHRIGQLRPVTVVKLVSQGTIEERVLGLHEHKRRLAKLVIEDDSAATSELDLDALEALIAE
jgi:SNF2 family DNA or RNA helicase